MLLYHNFPFYTMRVLTEFAMRDLCRIPLLKVSRKKTPLYYRSLDNKEVSFY